MAGYDETIDEVTDEDRPGPSPRHVLLVRITLGASIAVFVLTAANYWLDRSRNLSDFLFLLR